MLTLQSYSAGPAGQPSHILTADVLAPRGFSGPVAVEDMVQEISDGEALNSFARLIAALEEAREHTKTDDSAQAKRERFVAILDGVVRFLRAEGVSTTLYQPLHEFAGAFADLEEGRNNVLLVPEPMKAGADRKPVYQSQNWATAAAIVDILKDDIGMALPDALKKAASVIQADWKALKQFRKDIRAGRAPVAAKAQYAFIKGDFRRPSWYTAEDGAAYLLEKLAQMQKV